MIIFKNLLIYACILIGLLILIVSTSNPAMEYINNNRRNNKWWGIYDWYYGCLVGMSHLESVRKFRSIEEYPGKRCVYTTTKDKVLYLQGDSNTRHPKLKVDDFAGLAGFHYFDRSFEFKYHLNTAKKNILLFAITESQVLDYFKDLVILDQIRDSIDDHRGRVTTLPNEGVTNINSTFCGFGVGNLFNKNINQNLECNLFNYNFLMPIYSYKAAINYYLFRRASGDVVISNDGNYLFYKETVTATYPRSVYRILHQEEINKLVDNLNVIYKHYRQAGFKEVYLSILPATATLMQPEGYNGLIPIIENNSMMEMRVISIYDAFNGHNDYYLRGDVHWTDDGFRRWLGIVNEQLMKD